MPISIELRILEIRGEGNGITTTSPFSRPSPKRSRGGMRNNIHIEDNTMKKIVLTANDDRGLEGEMAMHFGHCAHFVVAHVHDDQSVERVEVQENPYAEGHQPGQIPQYIHSLGANVVVSGGMGGKAIDWFRQLGIEVATGAHPTVGATLDAYLNGTVSGVSECDHDHEH